MENDGEIPEKSVKNGGQLKSRKIIITTKLPLEIKEEEETENEHREHILSPKAVQEAGTDTKAIKVDRIGSPIKKGRKKSGISYQKRRSSTRRHGSSEKGKKVEPEKELQESVIPKDLENPKEFYLRKRRQSLGLSTNGSGMDNSLATSQDVLDNNRNDENQGFGSVSSMHSNIFQSTESVFSRMGSREDVSMASTKSIEQNVGEALATGALNQLLAALGFLKAENSFFDRVHDRSHRKLLYTPYEIYKYRTITDIGVPHDAYTEIPVEDEEILAFEKDPTKDLDRLNFLIKSSTAPVPSNFRRRGYILMRCCKYEEAIADFDKSLAYGTKFKHNLIIDPFNSEAFWFRHQLYLKFNNVELAIKDLDLLTDGNKMHLGAFDTKARIYKELGNITLRN